MESQKQGSDGRICKACGSFKPWPSFDKKQNGINGHHSRCKECVSQEKRKWLRKKNMKKVRSPHVLEFSKSDILEKTVSLSRSEKSELEKVLRSLVLDSIIQRAGGSNHD